MSRFCDAENIKHKLNDLSLPFSVQLGRDTNRQLKPYLLATYNIPTEVNFSGDINALRAQFSQRQKHVSNVGFPRVSVIATDVEVDGLQRELGL